MKRTNLAHVYFCQEKQIGRTLIDNKADVFFVKLRGLPFGVTVPAWVSGSPSIHDHLLEIFKIMHGTDNMGLRYIQQTT